MNQFLSGFYFIDGMSSKGIVARISRIAESKNVKNVIKVLIPEMIVVPHSENKIKLNIRININIIIIVIIMVNLLQGASFLSPKPFATNLDKGDDENHFGYARLDENKLTH